MPTTYETDNHKSGVMEVRGVKRVWVYDKNTGHFANLRGNSPLYSENNTEELLVTKLESYGAEIEVIVALDYLKKGTSHMCSCEIHIKGKYFLKNNDFFEIKDIVENIINGNNEDYYGIADSVLNNSFRADGNNSVAFDDFNLAINTHSNIDFLDFEKFETEILIRGRKVELENQNSLGQQLKEDISRVIR